MTSGEVRHDFAPAAAIQGPKCASSLDRESGTAAAPTPTAMLDTATFSLPTTPAAPSFAPPRRDPLVAQDGTWFEIAGARVDLRRRKPLARVLAELARRGAVPRAELVAAGWPGESISWDSARIRLRVAVATLRSMGLADALLTTDAGYALRARV